MRWLRVMKNQMMRQGDFRLLIMVNFISIIIAVAVLTILCIS